MKGLLVKDFRILLNQKTSYVIFIIIGFIFIISNNSPEFAITYIVMLTTMLAVSTMSYDSNDNGMSFIMTLPVTRRDYAIEKYVLTIINIAVSDLFISAVAVIASLIRGITIDFTGMLVIAAVAMVVGLLMAAIMIPLNLKYGVEKGKIVLFIIFGAIFATVFIIAEYVENIVIKLSENINLEAVFEKLQIQGIIAAGVVVTLIILAISMCISIKVANNKEF